MKCHEQFQEMCHSQGKQQQEQEQKDNHDNDGNLNQIYLRWILTIILMKTDQTKETGSII